MTTTENNKLIAEFMNYANNRPITDSLANKLYNDWNSLMEVVEKIERLDFKFEILSTRVDIVDNRVIDFKKRFEPIIKETKIEAVYNACVEFIKWYNNNK